MNDQKIQEICEQVVLSEGFFFIELAVRGQRDQKVIEVYIDSRDGISVEECAIVNRKIGEVLESQNLLEDVSRLDVSSPGVDRPLKYLQQYPKHIGRLLEVHYVNTNQEEATVLGKLKEVVGDNLSIVQKDRSEVIINYSSITSAIVRISFT